MFLTLKFSGLPLGIEYHQRRLRRVLQPDLTRKGHVASQIAAHRSRPV